VLCGSGFFFAVQIFMPPVISVEHLSKAYHLGQIGTGTFSRDLKLWWAKARGKPNPLLKIGDTDHGNCEGEGISV
jgi:lipopolysaccharide transport system ATP-binding protein